MPSFSSLSTNDTNGSHLNLLLATEPFYPSSGILPFAAHYKEGKKGIFYIGLEPVWTLVFFLIVRLKKPESCRTMYSSLTLSLGFVTQHL